MGGNAERSTDHYLEHGVGKSASGNDSPSVVASDEDACGHQEEITSLPRGRLAQGAPVCVTGP